MTIFVLDGEEEVAANHLFFISSILRDILRDSLYGRNEICSVQTGPIFAPPLLHLASLKTEEARDIFLDGLFVGMFQIIASVLRIRIIITLQVQPTLFFFLSLAF